MVNDEIVGGFETIMRQYLKIESYSKSIDSLLRPKLKNKINYSPYYQRNYVWDKNKATYFIESILLGTEIPPLVFFSNRDGIEVIDGRQRFETILKFYGNKLALTSAGLTSLSLLKKMTCNDLRKKEQSIIDLFLETKIRIIEFTVANEESLTKPLQDKIKKEIFARYNSGITPLKKAEIENAAYDDDRVTNAFKQRLRADKELQRSLYKTFFKAKDIFIDNPPIVNLMDFIRKFLVLPKVSINYYAWSKQRREVMTKLYEHMSNTIEDTGQLIENFMAKVRFVERVKDNSVHKKYAHNRLMFECVFWALSVAEIEEVKIMYNDRYLIESLSKYLSGKVDEYNDQDYHFHSRIMERYAATAAFFKERYGIDFTLYLYGDQKKVMDSRAVYREQDAITVLGQLGGMRLNKPEPSRSSIEDIIASMNRRRFLIRPSYQRQEVIKPSKSSLIIESILLGITLPAIFVYKRASGISEVIDGQQRLLTILGFIGDQYIDENGKAVYAKNNNFSLRKLRVLKEIEGKRFRDLDAGLQNKIYDFQLYIVEIEEGKNPNFDPVDLFIRLNDKPYPIREHSFEMWNSWVDFEIIDKLKEIARKNGDWFFVKQFNKDRERDRMENQELFASLVAMEVCSGKAVPARSFDIHQKGDRITARFVDKSSITNLFNEIMANEKVKAEFCEAVKKVEALVRKVKLVALDTNKPKEEVFDYIKAELDEIIRGKNDTKYFRRKLQDFYFLWYLLHDVNLEMIKFHRIAIKKEIREIFLYLKHLPKEDAKYNLGYEKFENKVRTFKERFQMEKRKLRLSVIDRLEIMKEQEYRSPISGAPIFIGDDLEPDHVLPLAIGGKDSLDNLQLVHKDENRAKGARPCP